MALDTYANFKAHIAADLNRTDLTSNIVDFIRLAEGEASDRLKTREMSIRETLTITDGVATIPAALQSVQSMRLAVTPYGRILPEGIEQLEARRPDVSGAPQYYAMVGEEFVFWPPTSSSAIVRYRRDVPALSDSNTTNWLQLNHPHVYLYGTLYHAYLFLKDDARAGQYEAKFGAAIASLNERDIVAQISGMNVSPSVTAV
jgi:hypothetical protein